MRRLLGAALVAVLAACGTAQADEQEAQAILDKAIKALGGEEKLSLIKAFSAKGRGTVVVDGNEIPFTFEMTAQGIERYRSAFAADLGGNKFEGVTVVDGDKGWRKLGEDAEKLDEEQLASEKRNAYIDIVPMLILPLKGKGFKVASLPDDKAAAVIAVTGPDGKDFTISFDKESGLPIKVSGRVKDEQGQEFNQETTFEDYKDFDGIKVATKSRVRKDGERYADVEGMEFKALDKVEQDTFAEPK
jgi:hypothetical protein